MITASTSNTLLASTQGILPQPGSSVRETNGSGGGGGGGGTGGGINGRGGDIADQSTDGSMPSKSVVGGVSAVLIIACVAGAALVYYRRIKTKEKRRRFSAGPTAPQGYYDDDEIDYIEYDKRV
ncbi:hypothetical protein BGX34_011900 [Mortierella sp. NVP85]|nr:hypothetical protein BGX34_011900 [Mortierella sp. NVP85]